MRQYLKATFFHGKGGPGLLSGRPLGLFLPFFLWTALSAPLLHAAQEEIDQKVREIASQLRCVVCQNLSVADSPSELAQQMRAIIVEQVKAGKSEEEIKAYFVSKYGEWVLLSPKAKGFSLLVWVLPIVAALLGFATVLLAVRKWAKRKKDRPRSEIDPALIQRVQKELEENREIEVDPEAEGPRFSLLREQGRLYADLKELEFDYQAGKLSESDYQELRHEIETQAAVLLRELGAIPAPRPKQKASAAKAMAAAQEPQKAGASARTWQLVAGGAFLLIFGISVGYFLTQSVRPRGSAEDMITGGFLTGTGNSLPALLDQGRAAFQSQQWGQAIEAFKGVLAIDPNQPEAHTYMGLILAEAGHTEGALMAFDRALAADSNFPLALWGKGMLLYRARQDLPQARATLEKLLSMTPAGADRDEIQKALADIAQTGSNEKGGQAGKKKMALSKAQVQAGPQGPKIQGTISIDPRLKGKADRRAVLFIIVRSADSPGGPPLAVKRIESPTFPYSYSIGPGDVMMQGLSLSGKVSISARLDKDGNPMTKEPGTLTGEHKKNPVQVGSRKVDVVLDQAM